MSDSILYLTTFDLTHLNLNDSLEKILMLGKIEGGMTEDEMVGWLHWLNGHEFDQTLGVGTGQGGLASCSPWGRNELDMTERPNWIEKLKKQSNKVLSCYFILKCLETYLKHTLKSSVATRIMLIYKPFHNLSTNISHELSFSRNVPSNFWKLRIYKSQNGEAVIIHMSRNNSLCNDSCH